MTPATKVRLDCAAKPVLALGILWLRSRGLVGIDAPVRRYIPEFSCGGKESITLRHLLTYTAGRYLPDGAAPYRTSPAVLERALFSGSIQDWIPGAMAVYDPWGSWFTLATIIERVTTTGWQEFLSQTILRPMGSGALELVPEGKRDRDRLELPYRSLRGKRAFPLRHLDRPEVLSYPNPAYGAYGSMQALGVMYLTLADRSRCQDLLGIDPDLIRTRQRPALYDAAMELRYSMGYGMLMDLGRWNYCAQVSPRSFGHHSNAGTWAFCDPDANLIVCLRINGAPHETALGRNPRYGGHPVIAAIYRAMTAGGMRVTG